MRRASSLVSIRGWEYNAAPPRCDCSKRQRSKDYEPQKRVTLVLRKPSSCFSKLLNEGQCQVLQTRAAGSGVSYSQLHGSHFGGSIGRSRLRNFHLGEPFLPRHFTPHSVAPAYHRNW